MSYVKLSRLISEDTQLESVLDDLEAGLGEDIVCILLVTGTYDRFMGYASEAYLGDVQLAGNDPLCLNKRDLSLLAKIVQQADARRRCPSRIGAHR